MSISNYDKLDVPSFATPLTPYLKPRQEILRIRQALTLYLKSLIIYGDGENDPSIASERQSSHLDLCVPSDSATGVKRIPPEITGLRRDYLEALRENLAAKNEYATIAAACSENFENGAMSRARGRTATSDDAVLHDYRSLLRVRRQHEKLQVFSHFLGQLSDVPQLSTGAGHIHHHGDERHWRHGADELRTKAASQGNKESTRVDNLMFQLEQAVIRAQENLNREKKLLQRLKAAREPTGEREREQISPAARLAALRRTQVELVQWIEKKLAVSNNGRSEPLVSDREQIRGSSLRIDQLKGKVMEEYADYVKARANLIDAISIAKEPHVPLTISELTATSGTVQNRIHGGLDSTQHSQAIVLLAYAEGILRPHSLLHHSLALQKTHLSNLLDKGNQTTNQMLDRLKDESHLLPEYPILSNQERFKHVAKLSISRSLHPGKDTEDNVVRHARAWNFASTAARSQEHEHVQQKIATGKEFAAGAYETIKELYRTLNEDLDDGKEGHTPEDGQLEDESDIWAMEPTRLGLGRRTYRREHTTGPWAKVNGKVGVIGEK